MAAWLDGLPARETMVVASSYKVKPLRWAKTLFFLVTMLASLLVVCTPPLLIAILDVVVPSALLSAAAEPPFSAPAIATELKDYDFRASLIDLPLVSAARSILILCVYLVFNGRGPYLGITTAISFLSVGYVSLKAGGMYERRRAVAVDALFISSLALAVAHIAVAYKTSCRERRKLLVYRIDIEAVPTYHNDFLSYHKIGFKQVKAVS